MLELLYLPTLAIVLGLLGGVYWAGRIGNPVLGANTLVSAVAVIVPVGIDLFAESATGVAIDIGPVLPFWIAIAGGLHSIGMTTVYEQVWWWDHLTHTVSSALIGSVVYGSLIAVDAGADTAELGWPSIAALTIALTFLAGVLWELIELLGRDIATIVGREPMLVPYGRLDTAFDLLFDMVGPLLVILLDIRVFVSLAEQSPSMAETVLVWSTAIVLAAIAVLGAGLGGLHRWWTG